MDLSNRLVEIFSVVLGLDGKEINNQLSYHESDKWDSLKHLELVAAMEEAFDIEIEMDDIIAMESFGKIREILGRYGVNV